MPTITFIRRAYSPSGGAEKYLLRLADSIHQYGWNTELVTSADWPEEAWHYGRTHSISGTTPLEFADAFRDLKSTTELGITFSLERVWEADFYRAGDGVHRAWLDRLSQHSSAISNLIRNKKKKHQEILQLENSLYAPPSHTRIIANSQLVADEIQSIYSTEPDRITVIQNGYDPPHFSEEERQIKRATQREKLQLQDNEFVILFIGSGWKRKGAYSAIEAMRILPTKLAKNTTLLIAGKGKPPRNLPPNVKILGEVKDVNSLYLASDIFLLPTLYDPFSNATLEAACFGLPVITSRENGFHEPLAQYGGGSILQHPNHPQEIAKAIETWASPTLRAEAQSKLKEIARTHTQQINLQQTLDFLIPS